MQHMSAYKAIIGSDSGLSPILRQFLLGANVGLLTNLTPREIFNDTLIETQKCSFWKKKMHRKVLSVEWQPFCLRLKVLTHCCKAAKTKSVEDTYSRNVGFFDAGDGIFCL